MIARQILVGFAVHASHHTAPFSARFLRKNPRSQMPSPLRSSGRRSANRANSPRWGCRLVQISSSNAAFPLQVRHHADSSAKRVSNFEKRKQFLCMPGANSLFGRRGSSLVKIQIRRRSRSLMALRHIIGMAAEPSIAHHRDRVASNVCVGTHRVVRRHVLRLPKKVHLQ